MSSITIYSIVEKSGFGLSHIVYFYVNHMAAGKKNMKEKNHFFRMNEENNRTFFSVFKVSPHKLP